MDCALSYFQKRNFTETILLFWAKKMATRIKNSTFMNIKNFLKFVMV